MSAKKKIAAMSRSERAVCRRVAHHHRIGKRGRPVRSLNEIALELGLDRADVWELLVLGRILKKRSLRAKMKKIEAAQQSQKEQTVPATTSAPAVSDSEAVANT